MYRDVKTNKVVNWTAHIHVPGWLVSLVFLPSGDDKFSEVKSCIMKKQIAPNEVPMESKNVFVITRICCQDCIF